MPRFPYVAQQIEHAIGEQIYCIRGPNLDCGLIPSGNLKMTLEEATTGAALLNLAFSSGRRAFRQELRSLLLNLSEEE